MKNDKEARSLELVYDIQVQLGEALKSLEGKEGRSLLERFTFYQAAHISRAAEGYIVLRKAPRIDASKLLIRPSIEAMIRILAVRKDPSLLYRMAYTELMNDRKLMRPVWLRKGKDYDAEEKARWKQFEQKYVAQFPRHKLVEKELFLSQAAKVAGVESYYNSYYRLYCQFTHAAFRAVTGGLSRTKIEDNEIMAACAYCGLEAVAGVGGDAPNLFSLGRRLMALDKGGSTKQDT